MEFTSESERGEGLTPHEQGERFNAELIRQSVEALSSLEALRPEVWEKLKVKERLQATQEMENRLARVAQREAVEVKAEKMKSGTLGSWDGHTIRINRELLAKGSVEQVVNVVAHEGRHAFQDYVLKVRPELYPDLEGEVAWLLNNPPFGTYLDATTYGFEIYRAQPLEADAWPFGESIANQLCGQKGNTFL